MRLQFEVNNEFLNDFDHLKERLGASSRAEVLKDALALLEWAVDQVEDGSTIISAREGSDRAKELTMPVLTKVRRRTPPAGGATRIRVEEDQR